MKRTIYSAVFILLSATAFAQNKVKGDFEAVNGLTNDSILKINDAPSGARAQWVPGIAMALASGF